MHKFLIISYHPQDKEKAEWIAWTLREAGHHVAVHAWRGFADGDIRPRMNERLAWADCVLAIISSDYVNAVGSMTESQAKVWDNDQTEDAVIPVLVRSTDNLPLMLQRSRCIDLTGIDEQEAAARLLTGIAVAPAVTKKPSFRPAAPSDVEQGLIIKPEFNGTTAVPSSENRESSFDVTEAECHRRDKAGKQREIIQYRSGDLFTIFFQKIGPSATTALISGLGVYFLYLAWKSGLLWRESREPCSISNLMECRCGYLLNISWSLTMLLLFPAVFFVVSRFYRKVSDAVMSVGNQRLLDKVTYSINRKWIIGLYAILPILWIFYFDSIKGDATWTWHFVPPCEDDTNCFFLSEALTSISLLGVLTTLFHVLNGLFIVCLVRAVLIGDLVCQEVCANPGSLSFAHPDGLYGLSKIRDLLWDVYLIIGLLTIYIVSYVLDKVFIQDEWQNALIFAVIYSGAWFFFFWIVKKKITEPLEQSMMDEKESELRQLQEEIEKKSQLREAYHDLWSTKERIETLPEDVVVFKLWKTLASVPIFSAVVTSIIVKWVEPWVGQWAN